jgi:hypothetical protein
MGIIAYTYDADINCIDCTKQKFDYMYTGIVRAFSTIDINGIYTDQLDTEGEMVIPMFSTHEWREFDKGFLKENPIQHLTCGSCLEIIDTYEHDTIE